MGELGKGMEFVKYIYVRGMTRNIFSNRYCGPQTQTQTQTQFNLKSAYFTQTATQTNCDYCSAGAIEPGTAYPGSSV